MLLLKYIISSTIIVAVPIVAEDLKPLKTYTEYALFPSRVVVINMITDEAAFSMNRIRNFAYQKCKTTHAVFSLPTQLPSASLYKSFLYIPKYVLDDPYQAVIIPHFNLHNVALPCDNWYTCDKSYEDYSMLTKPYLKSCSRWGSCEASHEVDPSVFPGWFSLAPGNYSTPVHCWDDAMDDSIVLVKVSPHLPAFDERIVSNDESTTEWILELRYSGFYFSILSHGWFIHIHNYKEHLLAGNQLSRLYDNDFISPKLIRVIRRSIISKHMGVPHIPSCNSV